MKLIRSNTDLNKAINKENDLGFVPTMGCIHKGHESLIKISKRRCKKTLISIFVNPKQFNKRNDYITYPRNLHKDLKILRKLKVDFVYLPTKEQIFKKSLHKIILSKNQKILCAKYRKGHFEGVLDVLDRFVNLISPRIMFLGKKDYQQYFLVKNFISKKYKTKVIACKTIRNSKGIALSSRNILLSNSDIKIAGFIANDLVKTKYLIRKKNNIKNKKSIKIKKIMQKVKKNLSQKYKIKIEYLECRNTINLNTKILNKPFKIFIAFYLNKVRLIDNF